MQKVEENPFIQRLEKGIETKMLLLAHTSLWTDLLICERRYENLELQAFGNSTGCIDLHLRRTGYTLPDVDFIVFYSSSFFNPDELAYLKKLAQQYSIDGQKRVTVGYSFVVPEEKRVSKEITDAIEIYSIKDGVESEASLNAPEAMYFTTLTLAGGVTEFHEIFTKDEKSPSEKTPESPASLKKVISPKND